MAQRKSAIKSVITNEKRHVRNKAVKSQLKTITRNFDETLESGKIDEAKAMLPGLYSEYDKAAKKRVIKVPTANRNKSRLTFKIAAKA
ncbi:MAG: 30S ribosomal protein S20 [Candidatus Theseobacter exili]|nr:30S ribosomal protein S20 [Candidatus Theseobacter exili]